MHFFINEKYNRAMEKETGNTGFISFRTEVALKGNHKKGPIPVQIWYSFLFKADSDRDHSKGSGIDEGELTAYSIADRFDSPEKRETWCLNHFYIGPQEKDDVTLDCKYSSSGNATLSVMHKKSGKTRTIQNTTGFSESLVAEVLARQLEEEEGVTISEPERFN